MSTFQLDSSSANSNKSSFNTGNSYQFDGLTGNLTSIQQKKKHDFNYKMKKIKIFIKNFLSFFFSRIGLTFLTVGYVFVGGFIFKQIEGKRESNENFQIDLRTTHLIQTIWDISKNEIFLHKSNFTHKLRYHITLFQNGLAHAAHKGFSDGDNQMDAEWSYPNSILYAMSIITTIGWSQC
jgi:hypothetical protein